MKRTRRYRSRTRMLVKYVLLEANDSRWSRNHCHHPASSLAEARRIGIENMFVDKEGALPRNHRIPSGRSKIEEVVKVEIIQALRHKDAKGRKIPKSSERKPRTFSRTLERDQLLETESAVLNEYFSI